MQFLCNVYPYAPFPPYFCYYSHFFGPLPPTNGGFVDRHNMELAVYMSFEDFNPCAWHLGPPENAGVA